MRFGFPVCASPSSQVDETLLHDAKAARQMANSVLGAVVVTDGSAVEAIHSFRAKPF